MRYDVFGLKYMLKIKLGHVQYALLEEITIKRQWVFATNSAYFLIPICSQANVEDVSYFNLVDFCWSDNLNSSIKFESSYCKNIRKILYRKYMMKIPVYFPISAYSPITIAVYFSIFSNYNSCIFSNISIFSNYNSSIF